MYIVLLSLDNLINTHLVYCVINIFDHDHDHDHEKKILITHDYDHDHE